MVWDRTKPSNVEKIQDLGNVIRPNWQAIEQASDGDTDEQKLKLWAVNLIDRNLAIVTGADTPVRIEDTGQVYCRLDGSADPKMELFFEDQEVGPTHEIQLSQKGFLGAEEQKIKAEDITIGTNTFVNEQNNFVWAYGVVPAGGGAVTGGQGLGTATTGTVGSDDDVFTVPLTRTPANTDYHVFFNCVSSRPGESNVRMANLLPGSKTVAEFSFRVQRNGSSSNMTGVPTQVLVIGGF